jgi:hypothetical protein
MFTISVAQQGRILLNLLWTVCAFLVSWQRSRNSAFMTPSGFPGVLATAVICVFLFSQTRRYVIAPGSTRGICSRYSTFPLFLQWRWPEFSPSNGYFFEFPRILPNALVWVSPEYVSLASYQRCWFARYIGWRKDGLMHGRTGWIPRNLIRALPWGFPE